MLSFDHWFAAQPSRNQISRCRHSLTIRSSRRRFEARLNSGVSLRKTRFIQPHVLFTGVYLLKRLFVGFWVSRRASPFGAAPVFSFFASSAPPQWRTAFSQFAPVVKLGFPVLASGSNCAVKPTRLRRAAYFRSLGLKGVTASPIRCIRKSRCLCQQCHYQKMELVLQAIPNKETCAFLTQMQSPQYREMEYVHLGGLSRGITA